MHCVLERSTLQPGRAEGQGAQRGGLVRLGPGSPWLTWRGHGGHPKLQRQAEAGPEEDQHHGLPHRRLPHDAGRRVRKNGLRRWGGGRSQAGERFALKQR